MNTNERLSWTEIVKKYPHQYVGLTEVEKYPGSITTKSAVVSYTSKETSYTQLLEMAMQGEITLHYTTPEENSLGGISWMDIHYF